MEYYTDLITKHKAALESRLDKDDRPTADEVLVALLWTDDCDNRAFLKWATREKLVKDRDVARAKHRAGVTEALGEYPEDANSFIKLLATHTRTTVSYNGLVTRYDFEFGDTIDVIITDFARDARLYAAKHRLPFTNDNINDAVDNWFDKTKRSKFFGLRDMIRPRADFDWLDLAGNCFDLTEMSAELVAAVLQKFIHQVVTKMHGKQVGWHLMPVLVAPQGEGKSYFVHKLVSPLVELMREAEFSAITDDRNIELWSSYILFLDEMAHATRSDVEAVKHVITADNLDRRPMRTNKIQPVRQRSTFIACSNKSVDENIKDETGARRFFGLRYKRTPAGYLDSINWVAAWQSVKHTDVDPLTNFRGELAAIQEATRHKSPVEDWMDNFSENEASAILKVSDKLRIKPLYDDYLDRRRAVTGDRDPYLRTMDQFARELKRLCDDGTAKLVRKRDATSWFYDYVGLTSGLRVVR